MDTATNQEINPKANKQVTKVNTRFSNNSTGAEETKVESLLGSYFQLIFFGLAMISAAIETL